ncbi:carbohydrate kinase [Thermococcus sp. GR7]|uniref:carbohydrate kinase n=1 Tax=unclassified Thermococcus TaxID=2627626 RepID=UPI00143092C0|nr:MULTISPECIES: carbohydrate kinase [unclassified Thermococcus]NJE46919.1 carbohydrate kinase [Thermococcus sp. GR7]NJE78416.1 carbohydrate kinase [Thermococcus sp. GR4]NJF23287.1 carbohydrate kinase [Thermococcus sp. GR5]
MKCLLVGHIVIDIVVRGLKSEIRIGGGAYYSALALAKFCDVEILTSVGEDFPEKWLEELGEMGIKLNVVSSKTSTAYELRYLDGNTRTLRLLARAEQITEVPDKRYDMVILNPVANEIPPETVAAFKERTDFLAADVQGLIRKPRPGMVELIERETSFLKELKVLHADLSELPYLKNLQPEDVEVLLASNGPEPGRAYLRGREYIYRPVRVEVEESTGAGDVFLAAFSYFYKSCPFIQALKRANAFTGLFLERRSFDFSMEDVDELAMRVKVERSEDAS